MKTTLFVAGFDPRMKARDLAYEFERYGRLVRLDIPAPKSYSSKLYAFVEFESTRDAEDAMTELHGRNIDGYTFSIQWARIPSNGVREDKRPYQQFNRYSNAHQQQQRGRSKSPYRRERSSSPLPPPPPPPPRGRSPTTENAPESSRRVRSSRSRSPLSSPSRRRSYSRSPVDN